MPTRGGYCKELWKYGREVYDEGDMVRGTPLTGYYVGAISRPENSKKHKLHNLW